MNQNRTKYLLKRFLDDECTKEELNELLELSEVSGNETYLEEGLEEAWLKLNTTQRIREDSADRIFNSILLSEKRLIGTRGRFNNTMVLKIAAVFLGLVFFSGIYWYLNLYPYESISTAYGETKNVVLPDGSVVTLNSNTSVKYKKHWSNEEERILTLEGEAFFDVTHKSNNQKFVVNTSDLSVEVLGTEFNISTRQKRSRIVLKTGKVKVLIDGKKDLIMKPGELVEHNHKTLAISKEQVNPDVYTSWKKRILTFQGSTLADISGIIKDNYGVEIYIEDSLLANEKFTGTFPASEDVDVLLSMLSKSYNFKIVKNNNRVIFKPKK
ncbi:MAG TPA: FecR domain-containing protein [Cytophagales bacterium]|nr:FecR domain-containing protein [Cytophagales bacterium]